MLIIMKRALLLILILAFNCAILSISRAADNTSTFWFSIHLHFGRAPLDPGSITVVPPAPIWLNGARILLAEDNPFNQRLAIDLLVDVGAMVVLANDGVEALTQLRPLLEKIEEQIERNLFH